MAYVNTTRIASNGILDRLGSVGRQLQGWMTRRRIYAETLRELNMLSDRDLADLGIARASIPDVAREAAYGK